MKCCLCNVNVLKCIVWMSTEWWSEVFIYMWRGLRFPTQIPPNANWFLHRLCRGLHLGWFCAHQSCVWRVVLIAVLIVSHLPFYIFLSIYFISYNLVAWSIQNFSHAGALVFNCSAVLLPLWRHVVKWWCLVEWFWWSEDVCEMHGAYLVWNLLGDTAQLQPH